jgi:NAD(P)H-dependent flavin oxidoreductase YrpB (nitropropane dioxygenase family)
LNPEKKLKTEEAAPLIAAGMGIGVSGHRLARAVSMTGRAWGTVSGTAIAHVVARELQLGDRSGDIRRALRHFPDQQMAARILESYLGDARKEEPFRNVPMHGVNPSEASVALAICANFVEVWLAKEGHHGRIGINYLTKIALPLLPSLYGAMLAGVDFVAMGAGIPLQVPEVLDRLSEGRAVEYPLAVEGGPTERISFDPAKHMQRGIALTCHRPDFYPIVSSAVLAQMMIDKSNGRIDGFIVEGPTAGGHNAPPRGRPVRYDALGQPLYGERDEVDPADFVRLGLPFWLAGGYASPEQLRAARASGATGIQVGTAFALCDESGFAEEYKRQLRGEGYRAARPIVRTDPRVSPAGFPFKVVQLSGSLADTAVREERPRICDMGYLRTAYAREDGSIGLRCPAEPIADYLRKGGREEDAAGRACLCNALMANIGLGQVRVEGYQEPPLITLGDDLGFLGRLMRDADDSFDAEAVVGFILGDETGISADGADQRG